MKQPNPIELRRRAANEARDAFLRAAAALTEHATTNVLAFALLEASIGILRLADADDDQSARKIVEEQIRASQVRTTEEPAT